MPSGSPKPRRYRASGCAPAALVAVWARLKAVRLGPFAHRRSDDEPTHFGADSPTTATDGGGGPSSRTGAPRDAVDHPHVEDSPPVGPVDIGGPDVIPIWADLRRVEE